MPTNFSTETPREAMVYRVCLSSWRAGNVEAGYSFDVHRTVDEGGRRCRVLATAGQRGYNLHAALIGQLAQAIVMQVALA